MPAERAITANPHGAGSGGAFAPAGIDQEHWGDASPVRGIFRKAFESAGLPYFPPYSFEFCNTIRDKQTSGEPAIDDAQDL
jgi:hypothetical protein